MNNVAGVLSCSVMLRRMSFFTCFSISVSYLLCYSPNSYVLALSFSLFLLGLLSFVAVVVIFL